MKKNKIFLVITLLFFVVAFLTYCTKDDQVLDLPKPINSSTDLVSLRTTTAPTLDGAIDAIWANSQKLQFDVVVPDPGGDVFRSYIGKTYSVSLRSLYDAQNIYFLAEWTDPSLSLVREPWYFDPATQRWAQEKGSPSFGSNGAITRKAFYEDKAAFLWNVNNSVTGWKNGTCYKSCHTGLSSTDGYARHFTNSVAERIDMWHWKSVRGGINMNQFDDQFQDDTYPNGRKSDASTNGGGYSDNKQNLVMTGTTTTVSVPKYVIIGKTNYNWITGSEVSEGAAKLITAVDANGVLSYSGGTIDPNTDVEYQRNGPGVGTKAIPGIVVSPYTGSRGDITCKSTYTGTGWVLEFQRSLTTSDSQNQDVDFSTFEDQYFGFAIFENAQIAHAIKPNLVLKFKE